MKFTVVVCLITMVLLIGGCKVLLPGITGDASVFKHENKPLPASQWKGINRVVITTFSQSSVDTEKAGLGPMAMGAVSGLAAGLTGPLLGGVNPANPLVAIGVGESVAGGMFTAEGDKNSIHFSRRIQENIGDWQLSDAFDSNLKQHLQAKSPFDLKTQNMFANEEEPLDTKVINANLSVSISGRKKLQLFVILSWSPDFVKVGSDEDQEAFQIKANPSVDFR